MLINDQTISSLLTTVNQTISKIETNESVRLADKLTYAVETIAEIPTESGTPEWRAKAEACRSYFRLARCDAKGELSPDADLVDRMIWSFLNDTCKVAEPV